MKALKLFFATCLLVICASFATPNAHAESTNFSKSTISAVVSKIPSSFVVEQTATLNNGKTVTLYYKRSGNLLEVYSPDNLKGYTPDDLLKIRTSTFTIVSAVKGQRVYHCTTTYAASMLKRLVNSLL